MPGIGLHFFDPAFVALTPSGLIESPEDVGTPFYWLDAEDGPKDNADAVITVDGTAVKTWTNKGSSACHPTNGTAGERPVWKDNYINGYAAVKFDGTDDYLYAAGPADTPVPATGFLVCRWVGPRILDGSSQFQDSMSVGGSGGSKSWGWSVDDMISSSTQFGYVFTMQGTDATHKYEESPFYCRGDWVILGSVFNWPGTNVAKFTVNSLTWRTYTTGSAAYALQGIALGDTTARNGRGRPEIAEMILFPGEITDDEKEAMMLYYADKYAITLDADYPTGIIGDDDFESYADEDSMDGKTGGTRFNGAWESH